MAKKNVTFVITDELDREIEIRAFLERKQKSEILTEALTTHFDNKQRERLPNEKITRRKKDAALAATR